MSITYKCFKATAFDGSTALIPKSQVYGTDGEVQNSEAWWVSAWFVERPDFTLQASRKKVGWFDKLSGRMLPTYIVERHVPAPRKPVQRPIPAEFRKDG